MGLAQHWHLLLKQNLMNDQQNDQANSSADDLNMGNTHLETEEERRAEKNSTQHNTQESVSAGRAVDDLISNSDGAAGTDRAGTAERKKYGDTELNKGLESQAMDEEGTNL